MMLRSILLLLLPGATLAYDWECNLFCYNNGVCKHGKGKFGSYAGIDDDEVMPWEKDTHQAGMYCACPVGWTGLQCEIKLVVCGELGTEYDQHTCFNGSECRKEKSGKGQIYYRCQCDAAQSHMDSAYAGKYCEHIATTFCDRKGNTDGSYGTSTSFCTNGGKCLEKTSTEQKHVGCECPPGYEGSHCEIATNTKTATEMLLEAATNESVILAVFLFICLGVFVGLGFCYWNDKRKRRRERELMRRTHMYGFPSLDFRKEEEMAHEGEMA